MILKERIPETFTGITGESEVIDFDGFQKIMRDKGLIETDDIIKFGITAGTALEIGPGPGYLGLEWLKKTEQTNLHWLEISEDMKKIEMKNAKEYKLTHRVTSIVSDATKKFPFENNRFDAVFSAGSLHEWADPVQTFNEIYRVLKPNGKFFIGDLKRNINPLLIFIMKRMVKQKSMKQGLITSLHAAYLKYEIIERLQQSGLRDFMVTENLFGLCIKGIKKTG
jgi:ubiquinone/menaquinone biosynthesis C-methylase UbiE